MNEYQYEDHAIRFEFGRVGNASSTAAAVSIARKIGETQNLVGVKRYVVYRRSCWMRG